MNDTNININFKSGLTKQILINEKSIKLLKQEKLFRNNYGIEANFLNNKSAGLANLYCLKIFETLLNKLKFDAFPPPAVRVYDKRQCISDYADNFCIIDTQNVLKNEYPYPGRSLFFMDFNNLEEINDSAEKKYKNKISSSSHFLAPFIHEWLHSFHLDYIYKTYGYGGNCEYLQNLYPIKNKEITGIELLENLEKRCLTSKENEVVYENIGEYSTRKNNQYLEIFSEAITKFICNSLDGVNLVKNPFEEFLNCSNEFKSILKKVFTFK